MNQGWHIRFINDITITPSYFEIPITNLVFSDLYLRLDYVYRENAIELASKHWDRGEH